MPEPPPDLIVAGPLKLRRWRPGDEAVMAQAVRESADHLRPWMPWVDLPPPDLVERDRLWATGEQFAFGLWAAVVGVGVCGLHARIVRGGLESGYWVAAALPRRGYATTAAGALADAALA